MVGALAAAGSATALQQPAQAQEKIAQSVVQYQKQPKNGQMCSNCVNFEAPTACKIVAGTIDPNGWCLVYGPKA
jgi:recombinational DNA repair protein RecR